jgi:HSP20 family protein
MYEKDKRSFFEKLTGAISVDDATSKPNETREKSDIIPPHETSAVSSSTEEKKIHYQKLPSKEDAAGEKKMATPVIEEKVKEKKEEHKEIPKETPLEEKKIEEEEDGELAVDVYEDGSEIYIQAMLAGVDPEDVDVSITRKLVTLRGKRLNPAKVPSESYFHKELYWGGFSRKITMVEEIDPDKAEAFEKHGMLILRLPKLNMKETQKLDVKSI